MEKSKYNLLTLGKIKINNVNDTSSIIEILELDNLYLYKTDCETELYTIEYLKELTSDEIEHLDFYLKDYFYYGYPLYKEDDQEMTECEIAFENSSSSIIMYEKIIL